MIRDIKPVLDAPMSPLVVFEVWWWNAGTDLYLGDERAPTGVMQELFSDWTRAKQAMEAWHENH